MSVIGLNAEQQQLITVIHRYANQFPVSEIGNEQLLSHCYDYMDAFKLILDSTSQQQMEYICQQYDGFYRFDHLMESLAQGIEDGVIDYP